MFAPPPAAAPPPGMALACKFAITIIKILLKILLLKKLVFMQLKSSYRGNIRKMTVVKSFRDVERIKEIFLKFNQTINNLTYISRHALPS